MNKEEHITFVTSKFPKENGWFCDNKGIVTSGFGLCLSAEDLSKIGQMCLHKGMFNNKQIVSAEWITQMTTPYIKCDEKFAFMQYGFNNMEIRLFQQEDAIETAQVIAETLRISNSKDYSKKYIDDNISSHSADVLIERAKAGHMYVVCDKTRIVGCGAIAGYWGSTTESILLTIFVLPEYQGKGIGKQIIYTLEHDEFFLRANRIEIPASITAVEFYRKMGYDYKNGIKELDDEQIYRLEKFQ